jgi:hypothetical protein
MSAGRGLAVAMLVLGVAQSCTNDFDKFEVTDGSSGSSSGGDFALAGTTAKAGSVSRSGAPPNLAGTTSVGGANEGGAPGMVDAGAPGVGGMLGMAGAEPEPCGGPCVLDHATAVCVEDACAVDACDADWGDCNGSAADGCEHPVLADTTHCGECERACATTNVASLECSAGACSSSCAAGFANCQQGELPDDGCETPVLTDAANCGGCDNACPGNFICKAGRCACDGRNDCGNGNGVECVSDVCECDQVACRPGERCRDSQGDKVCSCNGSTGPGCSASELCCTVSGCTDVTSDPSNCGACDRLCGTGFVCAAGACQCDSPQDCGAGPDPGTGDAGAPSVGTGGAGDGGSATDPGAGGVAPGLPIACTAGLCVCNGNTCAEGQRCLPDGSCG